MIDDDRLMALAHEHGTPLYIYDLDEVRSRAKRFSSELPFVTVQYALKANRHPEILRAVRDHGFGLDCASVHEAQIGLEHGFAPASLLVTQCGFSDDDLRWCEEQGVTPVLGALDEVSAYISLGLKRPVWVRVNGGKGTGANTHITTAGSDAKFGIWHTELDGAIRSLRAADVTVAGLHQSVGSDNHDADAYTAIAEQLCSWARHHGIGQIDIGGGLASDFDLCDLSHLPEVLGDVSLRMEPGRFFVGRAGHLVCRVQAVKRTDTTTFCVVDTGMQHLLRPYLYGASHRIDQLNGKGTPEPMVVAGNACENGDMLSRDADGVRKVMLGVRRGDLLAIRDVGAYGVVMGSTYCGHPLPKEVTTIRLVDGRGEGSVPVPNSR